MGQQSTCPGAGPWIEEVMLGHKGLEAAQWSLRGHSI